MVGFTICLLQMLSSDAGSSQIYNQPPIEMELVSVKLNGPHSFERGSQRLSFRQWRGPNQSIPLVSWF
jgi:hypothetical protein